MGVACNYDRKRKLGDSNYENPYNSNLYNDVDSNIQDSNINNKRNGIKNNSINNSKNNNNKNNNNGVGNNNKNKKTSDSIIKKNSINSNNSKFNKNKGKATKKSKFESEKVAFPSGEHYYKLIIDSNRSELIKKEDNLCEKVELFFSLTHVQNPNDEHSFRISIINNTRIGIATNLGNLENQSGVEIEFGSSFLLDFFFEREQKIIVEPIINDNIIESKKEEFVLCKLMTRLDNKLPIEIKDIGTLEISYKKKEQQNNETSNFQFSIMLNNKIFNNEEKLKGIYFVIRNVKDGKTKRPVYKSHEYDFKLSEKKKTSFISLDSKILCNNDDSPIFFELYAPNINKAKFIGYCSFNIKKLKSNLNKDEIEQIEISSEKNGKLGTLDITYSWSKIINFEHYIKNGQINLDIAIDYTDSNRSPLLQNSLHYLDAEGGNDYEKAIESCGKIIANYDYDQLFPVYGFGGIPPNSNKVSHCFNINFSKDNPEIETIDNIIKYYRESLDKVTLSGPTYFSPVIEKVMEEINDDLENKKEENHYYILLILTDGVIIDMKETVNSIVEASKLPLSIVIVGIGENDFENMELLDGDKIPLVNSYGELRKRDIVQFVKFNTFKEKNALNDNKELAEEVLKEIPRQIEEYYKFCGKFYEPSSEE